MLLVQFTQTLKEDSSVLIVRTGLNKKTADLFLAALQPRCPGASIERIARGNWRLIVRLP